MRGRNDRFEVIELILSHILVYSPTQQSDQDQPSRDSFGVTLYFYVLSCGCGYKSGRKVYQILGSGSRIHQRVDIDVVV